MRLLVPLLLLLVASAAAARDAPEEAGLLTRPPSLLEFVEAPYPDAARQAGVSGTVKLSLVIDETGAVTEVSVLVPAGHGFDEAAVEAVRQFRFAPAEVDGEPVAVQVTYDYGFVLEQAPPPPPEEVAPEDRPVNFRGRLVVRGTREPLPDAAVRVGEQWSTAADADGRFELRGVDIGTHPVTVIAPGYERYETEEEVRDNEVTEVLYYVLSARLDPYETVVRGRKPRKEVTRRTLTLEEVQRIPGTRGDALRVVQTLPGVARTPYGLGPIFIRGSSSFDSRAFLDGHWILVPFHFGGITSVFNGDLLDEIELYPGNFPARYGRTLAGVLKINTRPGRASALHGYVDVDLYDAGFLVEGPIGEKDGDTSFAVAARRSYVDSVLNFVLSNFVAGGDTVRVTPFYWDYQLKVDHRLGPRDDLALTVYGSHDSLRIATDDPEHFGTELRDTIRSTFDFHRVTLAWRRRQSAKLTGVTSGVVGYDATGNTFGSDLFWNARGPFLSVRSDWTYRASEALSLESGFDLLGAYFFQEAQGPAVPAPGQVVDPVVRDELVFASDRVLVMMPAVYLDAAWSPHPSLKLVPGLRLDTDFTAGRALARVDPRGTALWTVTDGTTLKAAAGLFSQPPVAFLLVEEFGNPALKWEHSIHYAVGVDQRLTRWLRAEVELFYQDRRGMVVRSDRFVERDGETVRENVRNGGRGRAYGLEVYLKVEEIPGVVAWLSYTLSRAEEQYEYGGELDIFYNDQTHNLMLVSSFDLGGGWAVGGAVRVVTGIPDTPIIGSFYDADADLYIPISGAIGSGERVKPFFSLDLRVDRRWTFRTWMLTAYLDVTNVTNYRNIEGATYNFDYTEARPLPGLPIFPSIGVKAEL